MSSSANDNTNSTTSTTSSAALHPLVAKLNDDMRRCIAAITQPPDSIREATSESGDVDINNNNNNASTSTPDQSLNKEEIESHMKSFFNTIKSIEQILSSHTQEAAQPATRSSRIAEEVASLENDIRIKDQLIAKHLRRLEHYKTALDNLIADNARSGLLPIPITTTTTTTSTTTTTKMDLE